MRLRIFVLSAALLMAIVAGQSFLLPSSETAAGAATVISYATFSDGCVHADLHVMRYVPSDSVDSTPVVATWCG